MDETALIAFLVTVLKIRGKTCAILRKAEKVLQYEAVGDLSGVLMGSGPCIQSPLPDS